MPTLTIKNVPDDVVEKLRKRARSNHRSMQGELSAILEGALDNGGKLTVEEAMERTNKLNFTTGDDSTKWVRELRDAG